ncbi:putative glyoxalase superfamily protein PhnB [Herbihabitans rhizosphaerae]|uniref:Putative glyoxalase superfamily protein PhnB n=1 Tax=Herbihabitans rhizosphaerae TaxID=1872711 RepID=A0A4Q7L2D9_9PSEU|nr:VOC family protein [Herbihabitans rhizosphaerae]RZS43709.1 putative glyoxalase superfamily protein PhnB [Herbihabitans rhizosphaerae]
MTDPLDALRAEVEPVRPDAAFAERLRERLRRAVLSGAPSTMDSTGTERTMAETVTQQTVEEPEDLAWGPTLQPHIHVADARRALDWYVDVLGAKRRGEAYVMPDGSIGHAELRFGDAVLMLAEGTYPGIPVAPPTGELHSTSLNLQVSDVDATIERAESAGATIERRPDDQPYGRVATIVDPFGHRWMFNQPRGAAPRARHGEVAFTTIFVPDDEAAKAFYGAVLGWDFASGSAERGWVLTGKEDSFGMSGGAERPEVQLCYRVNDMAAAVERVRANGGQVGEIESKPYGQLVECSDDQGTRFQLYQPPAS